LLREAPVTELPHYAAMLAMLGTLPADDEDWAYESKFDGERAIAYIEHGSPRFLSRNDKDTTVAWPELAGLAGVGEILVLDGEILADQGTFSALQPRMHQRDPARIKALAESDPVTYMIFDVLHRGDRPLTGLPYRERRKILEGLPLAGPHWQVPPRMTGTGAQAFAESKRLGLEGILCKRLDGQYLAGRRDRSWTKVKNLRTQEVVIVGWRPGTGRLAGRIGSLLLAINDEGGRLVYVGNVGTGFTDQMLADLAGQFSSLTTAEPAVTAAVSDAVWLRPELVGEVVFSEWTGEGRLRQPAWRGLRDDKAPEQVVKES
jgi:bifunctional non-homologous end joining protein LigD